MLTRILYYYYKTLYLNRYLNTREKLIAYQNKRFSSLVNKVLTRSCYYQDYLEKPFKEWPCMDKKEMLVHFDEINTVNVRKEEVLQLALRAEQTRDFSPMIRGIAVGLSSGTSGHRGLFSTSPKERDAWVGAMLAKILPDGLLNKERIALFLRANNPLYTTLNKTRNIQFHFFDLLGNIKDQIDELNRYNPTILSAPASVLRLLALEKYRLSIRPKRLFAVAEVLEPEDELLISEAFAMPVSQIYQCTEGFLAVSNKKNNRFLLNEEFIIVEKEWIDDNRFVPIITDLMRSSQPMIRYRLDDVLVIGSTADVFTEIKSIEGRLGDVCYAKKGKEWVPVFADTLRQCMATTPVAFEDYLICQQSPTQFDIQMYPEPNEKNKVTEHLNQVFLQKGCDIPIWTWQPFIAKDPLTKKRRIQSNFRNPSLADKSIRRCS